MKVTGIIFLIFAALNFIVALIAASYGNAEAVGQKISAAMLLGILGGVLYYFGDKKDKAEKDNIQPNNSNNDNATKRPSSMVSSKPSSHDNTPSREATQQSNTANSNQIQDEDEGLPKPLPYPITQAEMNRLVTEFQDQMLSIMADEGTQEQTKIKLETCLPLKSK